LRGRSFLAPLIDLVQSTQGGARSLLIFLWGAVQMFKSDLYTLRGSDPSELLDMSVVT
jgi:hypothetical protein